ncbi:NAD-dependent epimerase/dehydratase family protein [Micrococcus luteus]|uniref:NAD-dependent epimerase/dehydratase family protein n=1 Tax=Micrococcus luteus TaxID=1270 RepID=UPI00331CA492
MRLAASLNTRGAIRILATGGAGSIGSNFVHHLLRHTTHDVVILDRLISAGNRVDLADLPEDRVRLEDATSVTCPAGRLLLIAPRMPPDPREPPIGREVVVLVPGLSGVRLPCGA